MAAMGPSSGQDRKTYIVWCFEHYFKAEHAQARRNLKDLADSFGFEFLCEKKAMALLRWLEGRTATIILVAEWREAKPIMEELGPRNIACDVSVCVVTRSEKMFQHARAWAAQQGGGKEILVSEGFSLRKVDELVAHHLDRALVSAEVSFPVLSSSSTQPVMRWCL